MTTATDLAIRASPRQLARIAGALYLVNIVGGAFAIGFVRATVFASDPATTAANLQTHPLSIHHVYRLGPEVAIPAVIITSLPYLLLRRYGSSGSRLPLWSYAGVAASIFVWFGVVDGFLDHVLKALGLQHTTLLPGGEATVVSTVCSLWSPEAGNLFYEGTGILEFVLSAIALYHCYRLLRSQPERTVKIGEAAASGEHLMTPTTAQTIRSAQLVGSPPEVAAEGLAVDTLPALEKSLPQLKGRA